MLLIIHASRAEDATDPDIPVYVPPVKKDIIPAPEVIGPAKELPSPVKVQKSPVEKSAPKKATSASAKKSKKKVAAPTVLPQESVDSPPVTSSDLPKKPSGHFHDVLMESGGDFRVRGIALQAIRVRQEKTKTRVVFDFSSDKLPFCHINYNDKQNHELLVECEGIASMNVNAAWKNGLNLNPVFQVATDPYIAEDQQLTVQWRLHPSTRIESFHLTKPARLVVDAVHN